MKRWVCLLSVACILALCWGVSEARENPNSHRGQSTEASQVSQMPAAASAFFNNLNIGAMWFPSVRNKGYLGYADLSAWYPGGGDQSDLWQGGMWAGGYVKSGAGFQPKAWRYLGSDGESGDPPQFDTLDEQAVLKTEADLALPYPYRSLTTHVNTASKDFSVSEGDTVDGDLGLDVKYEWHQWGVRGFDNWVFAHVTIVFSKSIKDFYWGWMTDADCGNVNLADYYYDDWVGFDETYKFCYERDADYDPLPGQMEAATTADSLFLSPNAIGQLLLAAPPIGGRVNAALDETQRWVSANFWDWNNDISSVQDTYDRIAGIWTNPFPPAAPFDYRMLNGVGPYQVVAGDTAEFWMAYVMGEGYDNDNHSTFHMGNLVQHVQDAEAFFNGGMVIPATDYPPVAPNLNPALIDIHAVDVNADQITVHWAPYTNIGPGAHADSFIVYSNTVSKTGPWERVAAFGNGTTSTTVDLIPGFYTYVMVQASNSAKGTISNPWAMTSRLYETDSRGRLRANNNTVVSVIGNTAAESALDKITVAPNPYDGSNPGELREFETLIGFHHLPAKCTIYIYTMLGNLVDIIHHDSQSGSEFWDMTTRSNEAISSGLYVYRVKADNGDEKLGKFAVIKGQR